jgi:hypothetical protein
MENTTCTLIIDVACKTEREADLVWPLPKKLLRRRLHVSVVVLHYVVSSAASGTTEMHTYLHCKIKLCDDDGYQTQISHVSLHSMFQNSRTA